MVEWDNFIMRKYGQSIREKISEMYKPFSKGTKIVYNDRNLDRMMKDIPEDEWIEC